MDMLSLLIDLDKHLFFLINSLPHTVLLNQFFLFFSFYPLILWFILGLVLIFLKKKKDIRFILKLCMALMLAGVVASGVIKPIFKRPRPDISYGTKVILVQEKAAGIPANNDFAFPSGHAAIAFAGAYVLIQEYSSSRNTRIKDTEKPSQIKYIILGFAVMTAFSRIYLGKHFPLDVIIGAIVGWEMGRISTKFINYIFSKK